MTKKYYGASIFTGVAIGIIFTPFVQHLVLGVKYVERSFDPLHVILTFLAVLAWTTFLWKYLFKSKLDPKRMISSTLSAWFGEYVFCLIVTGSGCTSDLPYLLIIILFAILGLIAVGCDAREDGRARIAQAQESGS